METTHTSTGTAASLHQTWFQRNSFEGDHSPQAERLARLKEATGQRIAVAIPALNEAATVGAICRTITGELMRKTDLVDELIVVDGGSTDATCREARQAGAQVVQVGDLLPEIPLVPGKGESMWRSLAAVDADLIVWVDGDIRNFGPRFVTDLVAPLLVRSDLDFVKGYYRRPLLINDTLLPQGGGRVTELLARPLLAACFPELSGFRQPLAGEYAGRTNALRSVPFLTGYSVEVGLLIDLLAAIGIGRMAQADLGVRVHRNRPLDELAPMADGISHAILRRAAEYGRLAGTSELPWVAAPGSAQHDREIERPAMDLVLPPNADLTPAAEVLTAVR